LSSWGWLTNNEQVLLTFCSLERVWFSLPSLSESVFFILTTRFIKGMVANFDMYSSLHVKICVKSAVHCTVSSLSLTMPAGLRTTSYGALPGIGWCFLYTCTCVCMPSGQQLLQHFPTILTLLIMSVVNVDSWW